MQGSSGAQRPDSGRARRAAAALALLCAYFALALVATWPLASRAGSHVYGLGTPPLNVWAMAWVRHQLPRAPLHLFDANAFHPYGDTLAFSEHLFVPALLGWPVQAAGGNPVLAHNLVALASLALAGLGMHLLARRLSGDAWAAWGAGVLYAFHTWNINELIRIQILSNQWFPFLLWALLRYCDRPSWGRAAQAAVCLALQALSCMYWMLYTPLLLLPALCAVAWHLRRAPGGARALRALVAALAVALGACALFALPYARSTRAWQFERPVVTPLPLERYWAVLPGNRWYAGWLGSAPVNQDAAHFPGFLALALGGLGLTRAAWRRAPRAALGPGFLGLLVAAGLLLSAGPRFELRGRDLGPGPYAALRAVVPGFRQVRYPERFALFVMLGGAPLVAAGLARLRPRVGRAGLVALGAVLFAEHHSAPLALEPLPSGAALPAVYSWLAEHSDTQVTAEVPASRYLMERADALPMLRSTRHWKRTLQGFTGYFPPTYNFTRWRLFHFPAPESVLFLRRLGVDTLVVGPELAAGLTPPRGTRTLARFPEGHLLLRLDGESAGFALSDELPAVGPELPRAGWQVRASYPGAAAALDGDRATSWRTEQPQGKGDFLRLVFPRPLWVARVSLAVGPPYEFPMHLKLLAEDEHRQPQEWPFDAPRAYDALFARLLHAPRQAWLELDLTPRLISGLRLRVAQDDAFHMPWSLAELRLFGPQAPPPSGAP